MLSSSHTQGRQQNPLTHAFQFAQHCVVVLDARQLCDGLLIGLRPLISVPVSRLQAQLGFDAQIPRTSVHLLSHLVRNGQLLFVVRQSENESRQIVDE